MSKKLRAAVPRPTTAPPDQEEVAPGLPAQLVNFKGIPDDSYVPVLIVMLLLGVSRTTVWRLRKSGALPEPKKIGRRITRWNVGELRAALKSDALWNGLSDA